MFTQYFGHYLLNRNLVSLPQLHEALDQLQSTRVKLGVLSVNAGYMSAAQADDINQLQATMDKRFGEIAIDKGLLTEEQLGELLSAQKESHLVLGQALIDQGTLTLEQFQEALEQYKRENYLSDEQFEAIKNGDIDVLVSTLLKLDQTKDNEWYQQYLSLLAKNMIRFIDGQLFMEVNAIPRDYHCDWLVLQRISGQAKLTTGFSMNEQAFLRLASAYAEENIAAPDEMAEASVGEFLNLHNGLFLVTMSNHGVELELSPQEISRDASLPPIKSGLLITVYLSDVSFELVLSVD
ncbi:hypothetical protein [Paenibacillus methanolicus]|uniref:Chemotaxis phosphatase CheX-like protein n=1 Tax=Paenibacillus methanolicus TaxID=582686 RepID=A0A5S5BZL5_9BACL|nr:hypothetical protein [Paenibacillus methanolicus]TYP72389.1 hypothetical protein BCM02_10843 [Paenibacillus methanolicus]